MEDYTAKTRAAVKCPFCPAAACRPCQQRSLLNSYTDPCCYSCKAGWSADFIAANFPLSFRNDTLRKHRRKVLFEREKSMLPTMVVFVEAKKNGVRAQELHDAAWVVYEEKRKALLETQRTLNGIEPRYLHFRGIRQSGIELNAPDLAEYRRLRTQVKKLREEERAFRANEYTPAWEAVRTLKREIARWHHLYATGEDRGETGEAAKEKRQFIMRCPAEGCRGFLSQAYVCGVCDKKTCSDCLELLPAAVSGASSGETKEHTCKPESVESAKAIKKETRPCPKCGARIFKLEGCDQMYCTMEGCGTAFSWNSGQIVTGRIHNPHYYEWLRRNGGGTAPREAGDIPCGGIPAVWAFTRLVIRCSGFTTEEKNILLEIHRNLTEFEQRLREYPATRPAVANKELNVFYLMNKMTEDEWRRQLELSEAKFNRKREIGQILQTLVTAAAEILQGIVGRLEESARIPIADAAVGDWVRTTALPMLESLRAYTNDAYKALAKAQHMAVPQITERWFWTGIRALYREPRAPRTAASPPPPLIDDTEDGIVAEAKLQLNEIV
jgi:hypothetical protein